MTETSLPRFTYSPRTRSVVVNGEAVVLSRSQAYIFEKLSDGGEMTSSELAGAKHSVSATYAIIWQLRRKIENIGLTIGHDGHRYYLAALNT